MVTYVTSLTFTGLAIYYFFMLGHFSIEMTTGRLLFTFHFFYMIPVFLVFSILLGELVAGYLCSGREFYSPVLTIELLFVGATAGVRITSLGSLFPVSGHMVILTFFILTQVLTYRLKYKLRTLLGLSVLLMTTYYKIFIWNDLLTFYLGILLGILLFLPGYRLKKSGNSLLRRKE